MLLELLLGQIDQIVAARLPVFVLLARVEKHVDELHLGEVSAVFDEQIRRRGHADPTEQQQRDEGQQRLLPRDEHADSLVGALNRDGGQTAPTRGPGGGAQFIVGEFGVGVGLRRWGGRNVGHV